jgi:predicted nucleic acid-binding protein
VIHLIDTSALKRAYISNGCRRRCRQIISRLAGSVYIAEISVLELISALASDYRDNKITLAELNDADKHFWRDIAVGRVLVRSFRAGDYVACRALLVAVGVERRRGLRTQDAIVAYTARELAIEKRERVKLLTCDWKLSRAIPKFRLFDRLVKAEYMKPI